MDENKMTDKFKRLSELEERILSCIGVGDCRNALKGPYSKPIIEISCPNREHGSGFEVHFARGRFSLARALLDGRIEPSEGLAAEVYQCTLCGSCKYVCNNCANPDLLVNARENIEDHVEIWEQMRADLVDAGVAPLPKHKDIFSHQEKEHNPYFENHSDRLNWLPKDSQFLEAGGEFLFFVGCTSAYRLNDISRNFLEIAKTANLNITITPEEWCCGSVNFRTGVEKLGKETAQHNHEVFKTTGVKKIIATCAGCYRTLKIDYPKWIEEWDFEVLHSIEVIDESIQNGTIQVKNKIPGIITYHDPCHLGRHSELYDAPRRVIDAIKQDEFIEMRRNKANAYCCGAGGGVKSGFPEFALEVAIDRIKEAEETGAEWLTSTCPFCLGNLKDAASESGSKIKVVDLLELVKKAI